MKFLILALSVLFAALQYKLWFDQGNIHTIYQLKQRIIAQQRIHTELNQGNAALRDEIQELKSGWVMLEEYARNGLGMVNPGEVFYQLVD